VLLGTRPGGAQNKAKTEARSVSAVVVRVVERGGSEAERLDDEDDDEHEKRVGGKEGIDEIAAKTMILWREANEESNAMKTLPSLVLGLAAVVPLACEEGSPRSKGGKAAPAVLPGEAIEQTKQGDAAKLKAMVEEIPGLTAARDDEGETLLYHAAAAGKADVVELLLAKGADPKAANDRGITPLYAAAQAGHPAALKALLARKADPNARTKDGDTPLHAAINHVPGTAIHPGCVEAVKLLIAAGADVNAKAKQDDTPLHLAAKHGHRDIAELLLAAKADPNAKADPVAYGETPLHRACVYDHQDVVELLLSKGADINAKDLQDRTPLARARHRKCHAVVEFLRGKGAAE